MKNKNARMKNNARARSGYVSSKNDVRQPLRSYSLSVEHASLIFHLMDEESVELMEYSSNVKDGLVETSAIKDYVVCDIDHFIHKKIQENMGSEEPIEIMIEEPIQQFYKTIRAFA